MNITSKVVRNGEILGVRVVDGDRSYTIVMDGLRTRELFTQLLESGWILEEFPLGFTKDGVSIDKLPAEEFSSLPKQEQNDFYMMDGDLIPDNELMRSVVKRVTPGAGWRSPAFEIIKTRDDLVAFLRDPRTSEFKPSDPTTFMPLNSFCSPSALFSAQEYVDPINQIVVAAIEKRRNLSFAAYKELTNVFRGLGLNHSYTAHDFVRMYFSWGICGIASANNGQQTDQRLNQLGGYVGKEDHGKVTYAQRATRLLDSSGQVFPPLEPGWALLNEKTASALEGMEDAEVKVATVLRRVRNPVERILCDNMVVEFDEVTMHIALGEYRDASRKTSTVRVKYPFSTDNIPCLYWNLNDAKNKERIDNYMFAGALADKLLEQTTVRSDASTFKVLTGLGFTERNAALYVASRLANAEVTDVGENKADNVESAKMRDIRDIIPHLFAGAENSEDFQAERTRQKMEAMMFGGKRRGGGDLVSGEETGDPLENAEEFFQGLRNGEINLDDTQNGAQFDSVRSRDALISAFTAAMEFLGATKETLSEQVSAFKQGEDDNYTDLRVFGSSGQYIKVTIPRGNQKIKGYWSDIVKYVSLAAEEAGYWVYVKEILCETTAQEPRRHVGIKYLIFQHAKEISNNISIRYPKIETFYYGLIEDAISNLPTPAERDAASRNMARYTAKCIFATYLSNSNQITLPKSLGGGTAIISPEIFAELKKRGGPIAEKLESTFAICDNMSLDGQFQYYCDNATITPHLVIPRKGSSIPEYSFLHMWTECKHSSRAAMRNMLVTEGLIPSTHEGYEHIYDTMCGVSHMRASDISENSFTDKSELFLMSPYSLSRYYKQYLDGIANAKASGELKTLPKPITLAEEAHPNSYEYDPESVECTQEQYTVKYPRIKPRMYTSEIAAAEHPVLSNPTALSGDQMEQDKFVYSKSVGIDAFLGEQSIFDLELEMSNLIKVVLRLGEYIIFEDGFRLDYREAGSAHLENYAMRQLGEKFYILDTNNFLYSRKVPSGVVIN